MSPLSSFTLVTFLAIFAQLGLAVNLPDPANEGEWMGIEPEAGEFMVGYYPGNTILGVLTDQQLATVAYEAGRELKAHLDYNRDLLASRRRAITVTAWQADNFDFYVGSSNGRYRATGHAEANIVQYSGRTIIGGRAVSYTYEGDTVGIRSSCRECKDVLDRHGAEDAFSSNLQPVDRAPLHDGWDVRWSSSRGRFTYGNIYDCTVARVTEVPAYPNEHPTLPEGWELEWSSSRNAYYYVTKDGRDTSYSIPTRPPRSAGGSGKGKSSGHGSSRDSSGPGGSSKGESSRHGKGGRYRRAAVAPQAVHNNATATPSSPADTCSAQVLDGPVNKKVVPAPAKAKPFLKDAAKGTKQTGQSGKAPAAKSSVSKASKTGAQDTKAINQPKNLPRTRDE